MKVFFLLFVYLNPTEFNQQDFNLKGVWYIDKVLYIENQISVFPSFIECPYFDFQEDGNFIFENGMKTGTNASWTQAPEGKVLITDNKSVGGEAMFVFEIIDLNNDSLILKTEERRFFLSRHCSSKPPKKSE